MSEMLAQGIIKDRVSPFATHVLLVKKADGSWRFCIDYRQLNAATVKNAFPIPLIEEMFDDLSNLRLNNCELLYHDFALVVSSVDEMKRPQEAQHITASGHWCFATATAPCHSAI